MGFRWNANKGGLFRNKYKEKPSQPDHKGKCTVECYECHKEIELDISAWIKDGTNGKFFSLALQEAYEKSEDTQMSPPDRTMTDEDIDDDIPF